MMSRRSGFRVCDVTALDSVSVTSPPVWCPRVDNIHSSAAGRSEGGRRADNADTMAAVG